MKIAQIQTWFGSTKKQVLALTLLSIVILSKNIFGGIGESGACFAEGALRFWNGVSPYLPPEHQDFFKYSPAFALFYYPIASLSPFFQGLVWGTLSVTVFWLGISLWFRLSEEKSPLFLFFFVICSMEMDGPIRHFQMNAFLVGAVLITLALYRLEKTFIAGMLLAFISTFKIFMVFIPLVLLFNRKKPYWLGCTLGFVLAFALPALHVGFTKDLWLHEEWIKMLRENSLAVTGIAPHPEVRMISLSNTFEYIGFPLLGKALALLVIGTSFLAAALQGLTREKLHWNTWIPLCLCSIILFNPGTEAVTFVIAVPSFLFLLAEILEEKTELKLNLGILFIAAFFLTLVYNDVWPRKIWDFGYQRSVSKTFAVFILWILGAFQEINQWKKQKTLQSLFRKIYITMPSIAETAGSPR